jgi:hypothetical protein
MGPKGLRGVGGAAHLTRGLQSSSTLPGFYRIHSLVVVIWPFPCWLNYGGYSEPPKTPKKFLAMCPQ